MRDTLDRIVNNAEFELNMAIEKMKHASEAAAGIVILNAMCVIEPMLEVNKKGFGDTVIEICENFKAIYTPIYEMVRDYISE